MCLDCTTEAHKPARRAVETCTKGTVGKRNVRHHGLDDAKPFVSALRVEGFAILLELEVDQGMSTRLRRSYQDRLCHAVSTIMRTSTC